VKIDYPDIENPDGIKFVRLYEFRSEEARKLQQAFEALAEGTLKHVKLREVVDAISVDGTELTFTRCASDKGVIKAGPRRFDFSMSCEGWLHVAALTEVFCEPAHGYQWLAERAPAKMDVLLSPDGDW